MPVCHLLSIAIYKIGNNHLGLLLAGFSEFPSLGTVITSAIFTALDQEKQPSLK